MAFAAKGWEGKLSNVISGRNLATHYALFLFGVKGKKLGNLILHGLSFPIETAYFLRHPMDLALEFLLELLYMSCWCQL